MKQIALIKTGTTIPGVKDSHGDFELWFAEGLADSNLFQVDVYQHEPLPDPIQFSGIVVTGSPAMVSDKEDWSERTAAWLAAAVGQGVATLGVCYGHQLLAHALGGQVGPNPKGRQIGTVQAQLLDTATEDPLLGHLSRTFAAQTSHSEVVLEPPTGALRLATSPLDNNFSLRFSENAWGLQFHPEFSLPIMSDYIRYRAEVLLEEGLSPQNLFQQLTEASEAASVLKTFRKLIQT